MTINTNRTKDLAIGPRGQHNHTPLETDHEIIARVHEFKLLDWTLTWTKHIDYVTKKATKQIYFLKILRAGLPPDHLLHYYTAAICPVLEYSSCIWHQSMSTKLPSILLHNLSTTAEQVAMVWACAAKRRQ